MSSVPRSSLSLRIPESPGLSTSRRFQMSSPAGLPWETSQLSRESIRFPRATTPFFHRRGCLFIRTGNSLFHTLRTGERSLREWVEELKELLRDATRIRLRADVPVGAYLSGGLDSTYITSVVKRFFNNQLRTFSVSFTDGRFDEAPFQEKAVEAIGTEHRSIRCTERDIGENFPQVVWHSEVPMLRTAPAPLYQLAHLVRENNFKVVLTGEGSDEIFAGYDIFKEDRVRRFWARQPDSTMRPALFGKLYPDIFSSDDKRSRMFLESFFRKGLTNTDSPVYSHFIRWENTSQLKAFFSEGMREAVHKDGTFRGKVYCRPAIRLYEMGSAVQSTVHGDHPFSSPITFYPLRETGWLWPMPWKADFLSWIIEWWSLRAEYLAATACLA